MGYDLLDINVGDKPILSFENYMKWYSAYLIKTNGDVVVFPFSDRCVEARINEAIDIFWRGWRDHCIEPKYFVDACRVAGYHFTQNTYNRVCEMFVMNYLDDFDRLNDYLHEDVDYTGDNDLSWC